MYSYFYPCPCLCILDFMWEKQYDLRQQKQQQALIPNFGVPFQQIS